MDKVPEEIKCEIVKFLPLKSVKNLAITAWTWHCVTYAQIWTKPRLRKIQLQELKSLANHPIRELHTSDISEYQLDFKNLVQVLKKFKSLKLLIIDHFGYVDDLQILSQLNCRLTVYADRLKVKNMEKKFIPVLKMLNPESIYLDEQFEIKELSPSDILTMKDLNLHSLSTHHLTARYYLSPWKELLNITTLKVFRLTRRNYFSEKRLQMFNIVYVKVDPWINGSLETGFKEDISVVIEFLAYHKVIIWVGLGLYMTLYDVNLYFE